jgi:hypothetical protein
MAATKRQMKLFVQALLEKVGTDRTWSGPGSITTHNSPASKDVPQLQHGRVDQNRERVTLEETWEADDRLALLAHVLRPQTWGK